MMGAEQRKFKVGDRVRLKEKYGNWDAGTEGVIDSVLDDYNDEDDLIYTDTVTGAYARRFELVPGWQPKVGDRVLVTNNITPGGQPITKYEVGKEYTVTGKCKDSYGNDAVMLLGHNQYLRQDQFTKPATLTIEAGKFYKTRDGRKVGPIESDGDTAWGKSPAGYATVFVSTGLANYEGEHKDDLIAEWVDEPVVATIANDNAAHPVGTKLRRISGAIEGVRAVGDIVTVAPLKKGHHSSSIDIVLPDGRTTWEPLSHFVKVDDTPPAIVALIEDGVAKPATRPVVHASREVATTEAERLALLHPGQEFGVYVLAGSKIADVIEEVVKKAVLRAA